VNPRSLAAVLSAALVLAACSSGTQPKTASSSPSSSTSSTSATPTPTPTPTPTLASLLSGRVGKPNGPIFVAKVDNTAHAHPQLGLTVADIVYIEQVEGGVTRLAAVYSSQLPPKVGPVRSARISDIELLNQYGTVGLIYSGAQSKLHPKLAAARLRLISNDANHRGFARSHTRPAPYNVIGTLAVLRTRAGHVDSPTRVGYQFGPTPLGGKPATHVTASYPRARVDAVWSATRSRWLLSMDGRRDMAAEGGQLGATTFVIQFVTITSSAYHDVNGVVTPTSRTVGSGTAFIFRDGRVYAGRWARARSTDPTSYSIGGKPAVFAAGNLWVALLGKGQPVLVR
jgi:hypothetical protein